MTDVIQTVVLGVLLGGVYALMGSGLTLLFGVMRIVNLAHAVFMIVAAYIAFYAFDLFHIDPLLSVLITMPVMFLLGLAVYLPLFPRIESSPRYVEMTVLVTFALTLIIEGVLGFLFTGMVRGAKPGYTTEALLLGGVYIPVGQLMALGMSVVLLVGLWLFLKYSRIGTAIRATMQNRTSAQIVGVNIRRISAISFGIGMALAGASGSLMSYLFVFYPGQHWRWVALLLALIVLGGLGSLKGAVIGAVFLSVIAAFVTRWLGPDWSSLTFYLALFIILMVRPQGLFGKTMRI
jgi:branched-chain amino acid transport system permease protein